MAIMCVAAANQLVELTNQYNKTQPYNQRVLMTCKRLQKLLYFCEAEYMRRHDGIPMFSDDFFAWPSGPVIPSVYSKFAQFQTGEMTVVGGEHTPLTNDMIDVIEFVFTETLKKDTLDLVELSHVQDGPWDRVYNDNDPKHEQIIDKASIHSYYVAHGVFS